MCIPPNDTSNTITALICRFDLWEEVFSSSFFTTAVQHRALREGAVVAGFLGHDVEYREYSTQADNVLCFLQVAWIFSMF